MMPLYCSQGHENPPHGRFCLQCGEKLGLPSNLEIQPEQMLGGRYRVVRELGHGGFGRTYLAEDLNRFNELCVLKEFAPQVQGTYGLQKAEELFSREAGVLYKLRHPQIPKFRELFQVKQQGKGRLFLVQDFVDGQTYRALIEARKLQGLRFNEAEVTQLLLQILPVVDYIHSLGVIHRDISPDNLMLRTTDGLPVLIDFGGVKQVAATVASQFVASQGVGSLSPVATRLGKVGYAPHEQMQGGIAYPHSDLYALGATVLVLLTGKEPHQLTNPNTLEWEWRRDVNLSPTLGSILDKMLRSQPGERYQSAREVLQTLTHPPVPIVFPPTQPVSPGTQATVAVAPPMVATPVHVPSPPVPQAGFPSSTDPQPTGFLGKVLLVVTAIFVAGGFGWWAGNWWIQSQTQPDGIEPQPTDDASGDLFASPLDDAEPEPSPEFSAEERRRKEALQQRRVALDVRYSFYAALVNEEFWRQYPEQRGRTLGAGSEDAELRAQWDAIANQVLRQLEQADLSRASRRLLGSFGKEERDRWKAEANKLHISSRSLYDLADAKFFTKFPNEKETEFLDRPIGQVWHAMVAESLEALKSGPALEKIVFAPGAVSKQVSGRLKPGVGRAFIASLSAGQEMEVRLDTAENALFSIYSPSGQTILLEDSRDRTWSGTLPESGFYEFVVVSPTSAPINYYLDLSVEDSSPVESPVDDSTERADSEQ